MIRYLLLTMALSAAAWPNTTSSWPHFPGRNVSVLTGDWDFVFDMNYDVASRVDLAFHFNDTKAVPGAWDAAWGTGLQYLRGTGTYRTIFSVAKGHPSALHFEACSMFCRIYVDGQLLANHTSGGYTPFEVAVPASSKELREVIVVTSNIFSKDLTPTHSQNYDFYQYGGLIREVSVHTFPSDSLHLQRVEVTPLQAEAPGSGPSGLVNVKVAVVSPDGSSCGLTGARISLRLSWDGDRQSAPVTEHVVGDNGLITISSLEVPSATVWDPSSLELPLPLHRLAVELIDVRNTSVTQSSPDGLEVRFGLRTISRKGRDILINGKPMKLRGFNRHELYPNQGPVLTHEQHVADLDIIQNTLKGNFIRGSHYPQDNHFLDLCDERGILVWAEGLAWGNSASTMKDDRFMKAELETVDAMLDRSFNHPSIILWGFFNEGARNDASTEASYEAMAAAFRARDSSRLITWASNRLQSDLSLKHADVISFNNYPGWYNGPYTGIDKVWRGLAAWVAENFPESPFIISEAGAGGIVGNRSTLDPPARWSLEFQSLVDGITTNTAMDCSNISGISLWQFSDVKVDHANSSTSRPGGINNKGVVDQWRKLKPAAFQVAAAYGNASRTEPFYQLLV